MFTVLSLCTDCANIAQSVHSQCTVSAQSIWTKHLPNKRKIQIGLKVETRQHIDASHCILFMTWKRLIIYILTSFNVLMINNDPMNITSLI